MTWNEQLFDAVGDIGELDGEMIRAADEWPGERRRRIWAALLPAAAAAVLAALCLPGRLAGFTVMAYACEIIDADRLEVCSSGVSAESRVLTVGQSTYTLQYDSSVRSELNNEVFDLYDAADESSEPANGWIKINARTGKIAGFSHISPYPRIDGMEEMSDEEIRAAVERMAGDLADFSQYNTFTVSRPSSSNALYYLAWQVRRDIACNIKTEMYFTSDGVMESFSMTDACPEELTGPFLSDGQRDGLLEKKICEYLEVDSLSGLAYEIQSETLTYYKNKPAVIYQVDVMEDGFVQSILLVIS